MVRKVEMRHVEVIGMFMSHLVSTNNVQPGSVRLQILDIGREVVWMPYSSRKVSVRLF